MMSQLLAFSRAIRLSHSVFALPFALAMAWIVHVDHPVSAATWAVLVSCIVCARAAAMGFNRVVDRHWDAENPRTQQREIPRGALSVAWAVTWTSVFAGAFVVGSWWLGPAPLLLSPAVLVVLFGYSLTKRVTAGSHLVLGLALGLAPTGVWVATTSAYGWTPLLLTLSVTSWVAGFDILYATQDADFDRGVGLQSLPARIGIGQSLRVASWLHLLAALLWFGFGVVAGLGWPYFLGWIVLSLVLRQQHRIVRPNDLSRVDEAFFQVNGYVSMLFAVAVVLGTMVEPLW